MHDSTRSGAELSVSRMQYIYLHCCTQRGGAALVSPGLLGASSAGLFASGSLPAMAVSTAFHTIRAPRSGEHVRAS